MCLVSIIIPTFNRTPELLRRSILSVLNQSYEIFEIIVIDDNYNNEFSIQIRKTLDDLKDERINYVKNKENIGGAKSR
ncbi:glycosyltransferase, partial [Staphylococcus nepalensis]